MNRIVYLLIGWSALGCDGSSRADGNAGAAGSGASGNGGAAGSSNVDCAADAQGVAVADVDLDGYPSYVVDDCRLLYVSRKSGDLVLRDLANGDEQTIAPASESPRRPTLRSLVMAWEADESGKSVVRVRVDGATQTLAGSFDEAGEPRATDDAVVFTGFSSADDSDVFLFSATTQEVSLVAGGPGQQRFADVSKTHVAISDFSEDPLGVYSGDGTSLADIIVVDRSTGTASVRALPGKQAFPMLGSEGTLAYLEWLEVHPVPKLQEYSLMAVPLAAVDQPGTEISHVSSDQAVRPTASAGLVEWVVRDSGQNSLWRSLADGSGTPSAIPLSGAEVLHAPSASAKLTVLAVRQNCAERAHPRGDLALSCQKPRVESFIATVKKIVIHGSGSFDRLKIETHPDLSARPGEVVVATSAVGVNYADCIVRMGLYESAKKYVGWPITPGFEFAGRVKEVGPDVTDLALGSRVFGVTRFDGYASEVRVRRHQVFAIPDGMDEQHAAGFPSVFLTAWYALVELCRLRPNGNVLVHSAAGGVGGALGQIAKAHGCRTAGVVGGPHKIEAAKSHGFDRVIDKSSEDLWEAAEDFAPDGYDVVLDANGVATLGESYRHVRSTGRLVIYGFHSMMSRTGGRPNYPKLAIDWLRTPRFNPLTLTNDNKSVMAFNLSYLFDHAELLSEGMGLLLGWLGEGKLHAHDVECFSFEDVARAHERIESGRTVGKLVLTLDS